MITTVGEASAVFVLYRFMDPDTPLPERPTPAQVGEALGLLAKGAHAKLIAGPCERDGARVGETFAGQRWSTDASELLAWEQTGAALERLADQTVLNQVVGPAVHMARQVQELLARGGCPACPASCLDCSVEADCPCDQHRAPRAGVAAAAGART